MSRGEGPWFWCRAANIWRLSSRKRFLRKLEARVAIRAKYKVTCACGANREDACAKCDKPLCPKHTYGRGEGDDVSEESYCLDCVSEHEDWED